MNLFKKTARRLRTRDRKRTIKLGVELFENRLLLTNIPVTTTADNGNNVSPTPNSLRAAILQANNTPNSTIVFQIATGASPFVIDVTSTALLPIMAPTTIDGTTNLGLPAVIQINGGDQSFDGLTLGVGSHNSTITGLDIANFKGAGIRVESPNDTITDNLIGTDPTGKLAGPGNQVGILIDGVSGGSAATIGGTAASTSNTIGFNAGAGVSIGGTGAAGNVVKGNFIGTNATGDNLGNGFGIVVDSGSNTIGGTTTAAGNVIGFTSTDGIQLSGAGATGNVVLGNFIGVDSASHDRNNSSVGVEIFAASGNTIGGLSGNTFGFNNTAGLQIDGGSSGNLVTGNLFGTDSSNTQLGNGVGVLINTSGGVNNTIGGTTPGAANTFKFNTTAGIEIDNAGSAGNLILGNTIVSNSVVGVAIGAAGNNTIGGTSTAALNIIGSNGSAGVSITGSAATGNVVVGNLIGTDTSQASLQEPVGVLVDGAPNNQVTANTIAFSTTAGVELLNSGATGNVVASNLIGTDTATTPHNLQNVTGVLIDSAPGNTIGGTSSSAANVIGFNTSSGVSITGTAATGNLVAGNFIGTDSTGQSLGNLDGVVIAIGNNTVNANNTIGGTVAGAANTIAQNTGDGVHVVSGLGNAIRQNLIFSNALPDIVVDAGANSDQQATANLAVTSVPRLTTIDYQVTTTTNGGTGNYTVDFFATNANTGAGPAAQFLGSRTVDIHAAGSQSFTSTFNLATALTGGQFVTTTVTGPDNSTSPFATTAVQPAAALVVTNTTDNVPGSEAGSLRQVMLDANNLPPAPGQTDHITFAIPSGPFVINVATVLPTIAVPVLIDGTSQPGFTNTPIIEIKGSGGSFGGLILGPSSSGSTIQALDVANFGAGIHVESPNASILGNYVGTDLTGKTSGPGNVVGIMLDNASTVTVGGTTSAAGNTIGFNSVAGVQIISASGADNRADVVEGNYIGTDPAGDSLANVAALQVFNASSNTIGGLAASGAANTIGFNTNNGIAILSGNANAIRENTYTNSNGILTNPSLAANDIGIAPAANQGIEPPTLLSVSLAGNLLSLSFMESVTPVTLDVYELTAARRTFLGSTTVISGSASITTSAVAPGDSIIATATGTNEGTSAFSAPVTIATATTVTTTVDNGDNVNPTVGSLRAAIIAANASTNSKITFAIPGSTLPFVINLASPLPDITKPLTIDGTTQTGFNPANSVPVIEIDGSAVAGSGLVLFTGSDGSTIEGLDIVNFSNAGIDIETSGNTIQTDYIGVLPDGTTAAANNQGILINGSSNAIGGTTTTATNVIADNTNAAVNVNDGTGNAIRENLIFGNGQGIVLNSGNNANNNQPAPVIKSVSSVPGATTVTVDLTGVPTGTVLDFFASAPGDVLGSTVQAHIFLGTHTVAAGDTGIVTFSTTLASNQQVTATATSTTGDTSPFATPVSVPIPFLVTTTAVSGTGSLAAAIAGANSDTTNPNADTIAFQIPTTDPNYNSTTNTWTITITSGNLLQPITRPVILDATSQPGFAGSPVIVIDGNGLSGDGLQLGTGSGGSTIKGLDIVDFVGPGIDIESSNNTVQADYLGINAAGAAAGPGNHVGVLINGSNNIIGGTSAGAGNVIAFNTNSTSGAGVDVASGSGDAIRGNSIYANDTAIVLATGANHDQPPPTLTNATSSSGKTIVAGSVSGFAASTPFAIEFFASASTDPSGPGQAHVFLGSTQVTTLATGAATFSVTLPVSVGVGQSITATATSASTAALPNDTSQLSGAISVSNPFVVTTIQDNGDNNNPISGSLRQVIETVDGNPQGPNTITFAIQGSSPFVITVNPLAPLPDITAPVAIDGRSESTTVPGAVVEINGGGQIADGLTLAAGSGGAAAGKGSAIQGLTITGFTADGILIQSSNNTIGGITTGAGNVISDNTGVAVHVASGTGNAIRQNVITFSSPAQGIVVDTAVEGTPAVTAVASVASATTGLTTIDGSVTGTTAGTYTVEFFASATSGKGPAAQFLGSTAVTLAAAGTQDFTATLTSSTSTFDITTPLVTSQTITATVTDPNNSTSPLATSTAQPESDPFLVSNVSDNTPGSAVGSLRLAIQNANSQPAAAGSDSITFAFKTGSAPFVIGVATGLPLPTITVPVSIQGPSSALGAPEVEISGGGQSFDGLILGPGSGGGATSIGSTISGLDIVNFQGAGIHIESTRNVVSGNFLGTDLSGTAAGPGNVAGVLIDNVPDNLVGGTTSAANTIGFNSAAGVSIAGAAAVGNVVVGNLIVSNAVGVAISAQASSNTIGGTVPGAPNAIGSNTTNGVSILSGTGNAVRENLYQATNGTVTTPSVAASDIAVAQNANGNLAAPVLFSAAQEQTSTSPAAYTLSVLFTGAFPNVSSSNPVHIDVYQYTATERSFVGTADWDGSSPQSVTIALQNPLVAGVDQIVATATFDGDGTSPFSAPFTVASVATVSNTQDAGPGSLRFAIANATSGAQLQFSIPTSDPHYSAATGNFTISLLSPLSISTQVFIDGSTEATNQGLKVAFIQITDGTGSDGATPTLPYGIGLAAGSNGSTIKDLEIVGFQSGAGILIESKDNTIIGNSIGTDAVGDNLGNNAGIVIDGAGSDNTIGGATTGAGNTIGFNAAAGLSISASLAVGNVVEGNYIGTNGAATNLANGVGVLLENDPGNTIGGTTLGAANIIGFNTIAGVLITGSSGDLVWGNYIGTDEFNDKMGNKVGIEIDGSSSNSIGGTISGSIDLTQAFPAAFTESLTYSGTDAHGGSISGTAGVVSGIGNIIDFNQAAGITISGIASSGSISGSASNGNVLLGNLIGLNLVYQRVSGGQPLIENAGNLGDGIDLNGSNGAQSNSIGFADTLSYIPTTIGGAITPELTLADPLGTGTIQTFPQQTVTAGESLSGTVAVGNIITANRGDGVSLADSTSLNVLVANTIGATSSLAGGKASTLVGNSGNGISITNSLTNTIGDVSPASAVSITPLDGGANVVAGNSGDGIAVSPGTLLDQGSPTVIAGNLVAFNTENGIHFVGNLSAGSPQVLIVNNLVGTTFSGSSTVDVNGIPQGNGLDGIRLEQSAQSVSGNGSGVPSAAVAYNVSSDNGLSGINVQTSSVTAISYAVVSIYANHLGTDVSGSLVSTISSGVIIPFGNALDGILLNEVLGVTVGASGQGNLVSGNLGHGIETRGDLLNNPVAGSENLIRYNLIGTDATGEQVIDSNTTNLGNLSDGIFLLNPAKTVIEYNTVSNNRGAGIHAAVVGTVYAPQPNDLMILGNMIGTDETGMTIKVGKNDFGNGSDGIFLDSIQPGSTVQSQGAIATIQANVISGNHANGINLLRSTATPQTTNGNGVLVLDNFIGTNAQGNNDPTQIGQDFGNAAQGIFINQSDSVTVGGSAAGAGNVISGNHDSGIFISGTSATSTSQSNLVDGNHIGVDASGSKAIPNAVAGIVLSNSDSNTIGGMSPGAGNVVSGNQLDGILVVNNARNNEISGNSIGTDQAGSHPLSNSADGVFLVGGAATIGGTISGANNSISGNVISGNVISGNNQDGVQIFGKGATGNTVSGNEIGLGQNGATIPNLGNGVFLNDAGPGNVIGGLTAMPGTGLGNVISGNRQSGIAITDTSSNTITGTTVEGNLIGTDPTGSSAAGNGGYGVVIDGSSRNIVGGATGTPGTGFGNVISGNALAGVQIFGPTASLSADHNLLEGNLIGTNQTGTSAIGNSSDGVEIYNGSDNTIGGMTSAARNVISGNAGNGVFIYEFPNLIASANQVVGNFIGTNAIGSAPVANLGNGVEIIDGTNNSIGGTTAGTIPGTEVPASSGGAGNLISGNSQWGIQIILTGSSIPTGNADPASLANAVLGNYIGTDAAGATAIANQLGGVVVNNLSTQYLIPQTIGRCTAGAGNVISGNVGIGIELLGPQISISGTNNVVQGNLIGLNVQGSPMGLNVAGAVLGNGTGILIDNSPGNLIGGGTSRAGTGAGNIISGNSDIGIHVLNALSVGNQIDGNAIGTNIAGDAFPNDTTERNPPQNVGVLIDGASGDTVGGPGAGAGNVISGNVVGVEIAGLKQGNGQIAGSQNVVQGNLVGTDATGTQAVSNLDVGVFINNSQGNIVGPGNVLSANGIAGIEIFSAGSKGNIVAGNTIGLGEYGGAFPTLTKKPDLVSSNPEPRIPVFTHAQLNGVVILGASGNTVGQANTISGNVQVGVYITSRDFAGLSYPTPVNNVVSGNTIQHDGVYGVLLYDAPNNAIRPFTSQNRNLIKNKFKGNKINFRNYLVGFDIRTKLQNMGTKAKARGQEHPAIAQVAHPQLARKGSVPVRPRVPALFETTLPTRRAHRGTAHHQAR